MPTNENLSQTLVDALLAAGYTPRTTDEWIMSAIDYLHSGIPGGVGWGLIGNSATNPLTNFIGTTDAQDLSIRSNSIPYLTLKQNGALGLWAGFDAVEYNPGAGGNTYFIRSKNLFVGDECGWLVNTLRDETGSFDNTGFGIWALRDLQNGFANCAFGIGALMHNVGEWGSAGNNPGTPFGSGYENCAFGAYAMIFNTTGFENAAFGTAALAKNINGSNNVAMGLSSLQDNISGGSNTAMGVNSALRNTTGELNVAIGHAANRDGNTTYNTAIGAQALELPTGGIRNTALGAVALQNMTSGKTYNVGIGMASGLNSAGDNCTYLGAYAGSFNTQDKMLFIENQQQGVSTNETDDLTKSLIVGKMNFNPATSTVRFNATPLVANASQGLGKMLHCTDAATGRLDYTVPIINTTAGNSATINSIAGRFRKGTSGSTFTLTNSFITANSIIQVTFASAPGATGYDAPIVVAGAGSAVITFGTASAPAAPANDTDVNFTIIN